MGSRSLGWAVAALVVLACGCAAGEPDSGDPWDVLVFTHSQGSGIAEAYAPLAAEALGAPVTPHGAAIDYLSPRKALEHLNGTRYPPVGDLVRDSEIIIVATGNPFELEDGWGTMCDAHGPRTLDIQEPQVPTDEEMMGALVDFDAELDEIARLRDGQPTVLFGLGHELGMVARWHDLGIFDSCIEGWELFYQAAGDLVEAHGGTMVYTIDAFNGPNHDLPVADGLLSDGTHLSDAGVRLAAATLAAQPIEPKPLAIP